MNGSLRIVLCHLTYSLSKKNAVLKTVLKKTLLFKSLLIKSWDKVKVVILNANLPDLH